MFSTFTVVLSLVALTASLSEATFFKHHHYSSQPSYRHAPHYYQHTRPYHFKYHVRDHGQRVEYGRNEQSQGNGEVQGSYQVLLPDGRTQQVDYSADHHRGFRAEVQYRGEPEGSEHHASQHQPHMVLKPPMYRAHQVLNQAEPSKYHHQQQYQHHHQQEQQASSRQGAASDHHFSAPQHHHQQEEQQASSRQEAASDHHFSAPQHHVSATHHQISAPQHHGAVPKHHFSVVHHGFDPSYTSYHRTHHYAPHQDQPSQEVSPPAVSSSHHTPSSEDQETEFLEEVEMYEEGSGMMDD